jgi:NADH-quinone oxidoreductase subunit N
MALVYAETGTLVFSEIASRSTAALSSGTTFAAGIALIFVGLGFKLALVPFHLWTPDVYEGAPAPITAFIATVSKGAVFALLLRFLTQIDIHRHSMLLAIIAAVAIVSMFAGNLLALYQTNVKRILAYSSISHLGYLLVTVLAGGRLAQIAAAAYLAAYFLTTLAAFGVVTVLSESGRDADSLDDFRGLAWRRPWLASVFIAALLSLAGMPLTAGFVGKLSVVAAGVNSSLWLALSALVIGSIISLFYYLRLVATLFEETNVREAPALSRSSSAMLAVLIFLLIAIGVYPGPVIDIIKKAMTF